MKAMERKGQCGLKATDLCQYLMRTPFEKLGHPSWNSRWGTWSKTVSTRRLRGKFLKAFVFLVSDSFPDEAEADGNVISHKPKY